VHTQGWDEHLRPFRIKRHQAMASGSGAFLGDLAAWAWARHHNVLSWYIRPLFLFPYCYFAYKRSPLGVIVTLLALATSMAWFEAPEQASEAVLQALEAERGRYLNFPTLSQLVCCTAWLIARALCRDGCCCLVPQSCNDICRQRPSLAQ
jgi:hypothetical protein